MLFLVFNTGEVHTGTITDVVGVVVVHCLLMYDLDTKLGRSFLGDGVSSCSEQAI